MLPPSPLDWLYGDFQLVLESREHELLALLAYMSLETRPLLLSKHLPLPRILICIIFHPFMNLIRWAQNLCVPLNVSGASNLRQENHSLLTDLNGAGATRQTLLSVSEDEMQRHETQTTTPRQRALRKLSPT